MSEESSVPTDLVDQFRRHGVVRVPGALDLSAGSPAARLLEWTLDREGLAKQGELRCPPGLTSTPPTRVADMAAVAPRLWQVVGSVLGGPERIAAPTRISNAYICNYRTVTASDTDWHVDGDFFIHHPDSPEQALLIFVMWSDVAPGEGATQIAPTATASILRHLRDHPDGLPSGAVPVPAIVASLPERAELTGRAGDAWLLHPLTAHRSMPNPAGPPRLVSNPVVALREPLRLADETGRPERSPLETLTRELLGAPYAARPDAPRRSFYPDRITRWASAGSYTAAHARADSLTGGRT